MDGQKRATGGSVLPSVSFQSLPDGTDMSSVCLSMLSKQGKGDLNSTLLLVFFTIVIVLNFSISYFYSSCLFSSKSCLTDQNIVFEKQEVFLRKIAQK